VRATLRTKLLAILAVLTLAFAVLLVTSASSDARVEQQLRSIARQHVPDLTLGPKLGAQLGNLRRALQDAVSAEDAQALEDTHTLRDELLTQARMSERAGSPLDAAVFRAAVEEYYRVAYDVSRRLLAHETGERMVDAMAVMQGADTRASALLEQATQRAQEELGRSFERAAAAQASLRNTRLWITLSCLSIVLLISLWLSQHILRAVTELGAGLLRFGRSDFRVPIRVSSHDEFAELADKANDMAQNLERLLADRDQRDWQKAGHAGLVRELQGDMEPKSVAEQAVRFLARYLEAPAAALYKVEGDGALSLLGQYGAAGGSGALPATRFAPQEGLLGRAALEREITVQRSLPLDYLKVRSGLGEASPSGIVFAPLIHLDRVVGVLELAFFGDLSEPALRLLDESRETLAITLEVARSRSAVRALLDETQQQATRLTAQEEELRATNEELQVQQEELRDINAELTQQADALDQQRRELELRNGELTEVRNVLEKKAEELTTVSAYKSQFLANMSHELRTPLNSMLLLSSLLADNEGKNLNEKQVEYCRTVHQAGQDLLALINQVLDLSKVEAGKQSVYIETVALESLTRHAQRLFEPLAREKGLSLQIERESEGLPASIETDLKRVEQILNNLIGNAIKFTEHGSVTLRIGSPGKKLPSRPDLARERCIALAVTDTGAGISPEQQQRIFLPFEQLEASPDRRYGGTGLGLTIAREMAILLGGELVLESALGKGSTFTLFLPVTASEHAAVAAHTARSNGAAKSLPLTATLPPHAREDSGAATDLLVIEDDPLFSLALGQVIREQGLSYVVAEDGETGLRLARRHKPRGIVLDVRLSDMDGFALIERLRAAPETQAIPVHFVSALDAPERGLALGAVGYLTKPATRQDLVRVIEALAPQPGPPRCRVLIIEDDVALAESLQGSLLAEGFRAERVVSAEQGLARLMEGSIDCVVLDLGLPGMDGLELLQSLQDRAIDLPPVVVYTGRALTKAELHTLKGYTESIVLKEGQGAERVLDELRLFARRLQSGQLDERPCEHLPAESPAHWEGKKVLVADDDMRAVYALCALLRSRGIEPFVADTGLAALEVLASQQDISAVLIDVMMPEMDGYEAMRRIRANASLHALPIIALTAKAMKVDEQQCRDAGATAYLAKPLQPELLFSTLQAIWPPSQSA
jgi:signal transduction histidine kinase/DNA-binding response OmpR family regulator